MKTQLLKNFAIALAISLLGFVSANAQEVALPCLSAVDLSEVGKVFSQIAILEKPGKTEYCEADLGPQWFQIANSLVTLKNMKPNEPKEVFTDAFTYKAINENNWWLYFTKRAKSFAMPENCPENAVAFVIPFLMNGEVNLCAPFFTDTPSGQASTLMHEVRHFDGFGHVTCTQGLDAGSAGACDNNILDKGSYAISAQTLVSMARAEAVAPAEKAQLEAEAVFTVFHRFNVVPQAEIYRSVILSNTSGEVYKWSVDDGSMQLMANLPQAARVYVGFSENMTIYPVDTAVDAYRLDSTFKTQVASIGLYAVDYNTLTPDVRAGVQSISYLGTGGVLNNNVISMTCGEGLLKVDISMHGDFARIINLSTGVADSDYTSYAMSKLGELFTYKCNRDVPGTVDVVKDVLTVDSSLTTMKDLFSLDGKIYALLQSGVVSEVAIENNKIVSVGSKLPFTNKDWVSISPISKAKVFKK
jgi:hypothetical protein